MARCSVNMHCQYIGLCTILTIFIGLCIYTFKYIYIYIVYNYESTSLGVMETFQILFTLLTKLQRLVVTLAILGK